VKFLEGFTPYKEEDAQKYNLCRWWSGLTFGDILDRAANIHPEKEAFVDRKTRLTYGEARKKTNKLAIGLIDLGIQPKAWTQLSSNEIISFLKEQKASVLQLPERIEFIDAMSYTGTEKLDKKSLRKDIEKKLQEPA